MNIIFQTWPWYVSGFLIGMITFLNIFRKTFGMSSNLRSLCSMIWLRNVFAFDFDWKAQRWNLIVVLGAMMGGFVAVQFMILQMLL
jgi:hypothetical protein